ncbi:hypothetical protein [Ezakiella coagulans]|uniref:hypothetical protein n=1 Tax=Ezakiella coagulans TaxID=46507 RepID=UPI00288967F3|nr:hypothetical protein [Ezakiella coagulans]
MYKNTFLMRNGDTVVDKDLILIGGQEELRQNIENRLSVNESEWFLNLELGLKYKNIEGKGITDKEIEFAVRECCLEDDRIKSVKDFKVERNAQLRTAKIGFTMIDGEDKPLYMSEVVDLG